MAAAFLLRPVCYAERKPRWSSAMVGSISDNSSSVVAPAAFAVTSSQPPPSFHRRAIERDISGKLS